MTLEDLRKTIIDGCSGGKLEADPEPAKVSNEKGDGEGKTKIANDNAASADSGMLGASSSDSSCTLHSISYLPGSLLPLIVLSSSRVGMVAC